MFVKRHLPCLPQALVALTALLLAAGAQARPEGISADDQSPTASQRLPGSQWEKLEEYPRLRLSLLGGVFSYLSQDMGLQDDFSGIGGGVAVEYLVSEPAGLGGSHQFSSAAKGDARITTQMTGFHLLLHTGAPKDAHAFLGAGLGILNSRLDGLEAGNESALGIGPDFILGYHFPLGGFFGLEARIRGSYIRADVGDATLDLSNLLAGLGLNARF